MSCGCCGECPEWTEPIPFCLVLLLIAWLYGICTFYVLPVSPWYHCIGFQTCFALLSTSLFKCRRSTDSELRSAKCPERLKLYEDSDFVEAKFDGSRRVCRKCNNTPKPDRAHHCSSCNTCILKMDHHCVFINKCIGFYNYKFFLLFLIWAAISCWYQAYLSYVQVLETHAVQTYILYQSSQLQFTTVSLHIAVSCFVGFCVGCAISLFFLLHLYLVLSNTTTLEYFEKRRSGCDNIYDLGVLENLQRVFGSWREMIYWFLPVLTPYSRQGDGIVFPLSSKKSV